MAVAAAVTVTGVGRDEAAWPAICRTFASCSFGPDELALLQRIVDLAVADLGILNEKEKSAIATRVIAAAERDTFGILIFSWRMRKGTFRTPLVSRLSGSSKRRTGS